MPHARGLVEPRKVAWYGYIRDDRDARDLWYQPPAGDPPPRADVRGTCPPPMNQAAIGSCVAQASTGALRHSLIASGQQDVDLSRLQLYYDCREAQGTVNSDSGTQIRTAIKCLAKIGCGHELLWPYDTRRWQQRPPMAVYRDAHNFEALQYRRVRVDARHVRWAIAEGYPVIVGLSLYESFETEAVTRTGFVPMPNLLREKMIGGHCMYAPAYGQYGELITVRNSWGEWGDRGDCYMPAEMIGSTEYGGDYWIIQVAGHGEDAFARGRPH